MQHVREAEVRVERVPLASLKAYDGNAKRHDNENIEAIENSIKEFGFRNPIIAWHNEDGVPEIVAGHGRALAAQRLGIQEVPVVFVDDLSDAQRRMLTLADNQTTLMTGWDETQLESELDALASVFEVEDFGFSFDLEREFEEEPAEEENRPFGKYVVMSVFGIEDVEKAEELESMSKSMGADTYTSGVGNA